VAATVVCVSHASGALGPEVAHAVATRLGYRYVDEEIVAEAARKEGLDAEDVADAERRKGFLARLFEGWPAAGAVGMDAGAAYAAALIPEYAAGPRVPEEHHRELIREAIEDTADRGSAVIVSHAASIALAGRPGVLRVLVTASEDTRASRLGDIDREAALDAVRDSDEARADYFKRFYGVDREQPTHYDVVVNTDWLTAEQAAEVVVRAAGVL
jgi:cytidylate kinase